MTYTHTHRAEDLLDRQAPRSCLLAGRNLGTDLHHRWGGWENMRFWQRKAQICIIINTVELIFHPFTVNRIDR